MTSVGETLRRERLKRNLDLDSISKELKIAPRLLEAIEADQYDRLPGAIFAKAFVRQYARFLSLDDESLAAQIQRTVEPEPPQLAEKPKPSVSPIGVEKIEEWRTVGDRGFRISGPLSAAALVVVVMLICSGVYAWLQRPRVPAVSKTTAPAKVEAPPPVKVETPPPVNVVTPPPPVTAEAPSTGAASAAVAAPQLPPARGPVHVEIAAEETVWVLVRIDGKVAFSGTMAAHTNRTVDAEREVVLRLGNAGGVSLSLNGKPIGAAGPRGQVRTLQLTSGGFHILSAIPAAAAADRL